ncbi:MAG: DUF4349 domain-containing protein [Mariprofundaceae bacterium]|nr:DUF4349 domain-containing protein [Mariprofundaceae bacterium]
MTKNHKSADQALHQFDIREMAASAPESMPAPSVMMASRRNSRAMHRSKSKKENTTIKRKKHYNAYLKMRTPKPESLLKKISQIVKQADGYIERQSGHSITFRIPEKKLIPIYKKAQTWGDVLKKSLTVEDITAAFEDLSLRLSIARQARDHLLSLLNQSKDEDVKLKLLTEITRLNEKIEQLQATLSFVDKLAKYAKFTVHAVPRQAFSRSQENFTVDALRWIQALSPFRRDIAKSGQSVALTAPKGMVEIKNDRYWLAESADGAVVWSYQLKTPLMATTEFWLKAARHQLCREFASCTSQTVGNYEVIEMHSRDKPNYVYLLGLQAKDNKLKLIEAYLPTQEHAQRYQQAIFDHIQGQVKP